MRKTYEKAIALLMSPLPKGGKVGKYDVVRVIQTELGSLVPVFSKVWTYHNNEIARFKDNKVEVNWQGRYTHSTAERMRALAFAFGSRMPEKCRGWLKIA